MSSRSLNLTAAKAVPGAGSAERFFQWSLYVLVVVGFTALMGTNKLDLPSLFLVLPALLLRGYFLLMHKTVAISERWTTALTVLYFAFYTADYFYFSQSFINATVHMVLFSMIIKIFSVRRDRDLMYLAVLSFLMLLAAAVLTVDTLFLRYILAVHSGGHRHFHQHGDAAVGAGNAGSRRFSAGRRQVPQFAGRHFSHSRIADAGGRGAHFLHPAARQLQRIPSQPGRAEFAGQRIQSGSQPGRDRADPAIQQRGNAYPGAVREAAQRS